MKLAIQNSKFGFHPSWISYCQKEVIPYKLVNCYSNDIINQLSDCYGLLWHHNQGDPKDIIIAKQILFALEHTGFKVFPDFYTNWHFDDKLGQKYLLERISAPSIKSYIFLNKQDAFDWARNTTFPKVWKLRSGAGSSNVQIVSTQTDAIRIIKKSFGIGFKKYDAWNNLKERWRKFRSGQTDLLSIGKGIIRLGYEPLFSKINGRERGYVYFQDFIPNNDSDIRVIIIGGKAFAIKRMVRKNDFRASGSGNIKYDKHEFDINCIKIAFRFAELLKFQCIAFDFVFDEQRNPLIIELSYGFTPHAYYNCPGYWDSELNWHEGTFNFQGWMVDLMTN